MLENMSEVELVRFQKEFPELASKLIGGIVDKFKAENMQTRVPKETGNRYSGASNATYYTKHYADKALQVVEQFLTDKDSDLLVPYKIIGLSRSSSKVFYTQAFHFIVDNPTQFDAELVELTKHLKHKSTENGLRFSYVAAATSDVMIRIPKEKQTAEPAAPAANLILNWRSQIEEFLDTGDVGSSITLAPVFLTDEEVQDFSEFLSEWGGLLHVVRNEKITVKKMQSKLTQVQ